MFPPFFLPLPLASISILMQMGASSEHFSDAELACKGNDCCGHQNHCTPPLVDGLELFRKFAEDLWRAKYGPAAEFPGVDVHAAYRCLKHNAKTTGAVSDSQHTTGRAADISVEGLTGAELEQCALRVINFAKGGIGRDDVRNMVHVDCRPTLARWCYYKQPDGSVKWGPYEAPISAGSLLA